MKCPRCIEKMEPVEIVEYDSWGCIYCRGHWIELEALEKIVNKLKPEQEKCAPFRSSDLSLLTPSSKVCPTCPETNLRVLDSNELELDICKECKGIFFDDGELEQLAGELPEKEGISPLGWVLVGLLARVAIGGAGSA